MTPAFTLAPGLDWDGRHLYRLWPSGRRQYVGSIAREVPRRRWTVWVRSARIAYIASYSDEAGAREGLEEYARGDHQ